MWSSGTSLELPRIPAPGHSLAQPVILGSEAPATVPLVQHHEPAMDRVEQLQGLPSGILCTKGTRQQSPGTLGTSRSHTLIILPTVAALECFPDPHGLQREGFCASGMTDSLFFKQS